MLTWHVHKGQSGHQDTVLLPMGSCGGVLRQPHRVHGRRALVHAAQIRHLRGKRVRA
jgi:hypothetical protein